MSTAKEQAYLIIGIVHQAPEQGPMLNEDMGSKLEDLNAAVNNLYVRFQRDPINASMIRLGLRTDDGREGYAYISLTGEELFLTVPV